MRDILKSQSSMRLCATLAAAAGLAMAGGPVLAQVTTLEELTVTGRAGVDGEPRELSRAVSYADLDLTTEVGQGELERRIEATASELCEALDEPDTSSPMLPSCEDAAVRDAMQQSRTLIASATPRGPGWAPMPAVAAVAVPVPTTVAPAATTYAAPASVTVETLTNGPVPDTPENRQKYGGPMSNAGKRTTPAGN